MCSPEPGKGGGGGRGSRSGRRNNSGNGSSGSGSGLGGLSEFWSCLDPNQRDSLLTINGRAVRDALDCELCRDLVSSATFALEEETKVDLQPPPPPGPKGSLNALVKAKPKQPPKHRPKPTASGLRVIGDNAFMADWVGWPEIHQRWPCYVKYLAGVFALQPSEVLDRSVSEMADIDEPWESVAREPELGCYCKGKLILHVVDMLTYPRPVRKFEVLIDKETSVQGLRELMLANVKLEALPKLVLLTRGRPIGHDKNHLNLAELGFKNRQQLVVSQVLGGGTTDDTGTEEKNRQFVGDLLFGGTAPNDASSSAPKLSKAMTGRRVDDAERGAGRGGRASSGGRLPPHACLPPPPPPPLDGDDDRDGEEDDESGTGRKRAADTEDGDGHPRYHDRVDDRDKENGGYAGDVSGHDHGHDQEDGGAENQPAVLGRTLEGVMSSLDTVAATEGPGGPELLALSVLSLGPDGEVSGEPGTGRVPSLFANHGFQVLGQTLSRLARGQVAEAWKAELKAREHESRLLQELEAEEGAGEDEGAAVRRRSKKAKKKERDKKRREEEKRLQDEEEAKRELARQEKIRLAAERVVDERRARQLQEREEQERQEAQWKLAQERRMQAEREQLEAQLSLLRLQGESGENAPDAKDKPSAKSSSSKVEGTGHGEGRGQPPASGGGASGSGKDKKSKKAKKQEQKQQKGAQQPQPTTAPQKQQQQQQQQQQIASQASPPRISKGIIGSRVVAAAAAAGNGSGGGMIGANGRGSSSMGNVATASAASSEITDTISQFAGIGFSASPSPVTVTTPVVPVPLPQQQQQQHRAPPGPIGPPARRTPSPSILQHPTSTSTSAAAAIGQHQHQQPPSSTTGFAHHSHPHQQCAPVTSLAALQQATAASSREAGEPGVSHGLTVGVTSAVAPADTVMVNAGVVQAAGAGEGGNGGAAAAAAAIAANFCAFCGGRLVAPTANFCAFCGQRVIRSPEVAQTLSATPSLALPTSQQQHQQPPLMSHAAVRGPPGPVGGGLGHQPQARGPVIGVGSRSSSSSSYLGAPDMLPVGGGSGGGNSAIGVNGGSAPGHALDSSSSGSSSLPFFQQFREANGGGGLALSAGVSAAPGAGRPTRRSHDGVHGQREKGAGEVVEADGGGGGGASALRGILGGGMGPLGGVDGEGDNTNDSIHPW
eukprot:g10959.t1